MFQTAAGNMILVLHLVILLCWSNHAAGLNKTDCQRIGDAYKNLNLAEELIQVAKKKLPTNCLSCLPMDCEDLFNIGETKSGVYSVWPKNRIVSGSISVYCDMDTDGGGWTVIQRRGDFGRPKDFFKQEWKGYKKGFGNMTEDFWLGNDKIYALSNQKLYSVRFDLGDLKGDKRYAVYKEFWIDDEFGNYTLHVSGYSGDAGDSFSAHNGRMFSTKDRDNNVCSFVYGGGWWFTTNCLPSNLNGEYLPGKLEEQKKHEGLQWRTFKGLKESLATSEIKIRATRDLS